MANYSPPSSERGRGEALFLLHYFTFYYQPRHPHNCFISQLRWYCVIIYSFTVQHRYQLDFLTANCFEENGHIIDRKLNVAVTRARKQMIITGNEMVLNQDPIFKELIASCERVT